MSGQDGLVKLDRQVAVLEERMNTMNERYDKGWSLLREDLAKRDAELAKRDRNMSIQIYAVAFGIVVVILGIGGTIISLLV
ncbi:MAG: hypothetical protein OXD45_09765 [Rhodobacteraceae bacterium]|nr:hypothetical protein [Paracoccaceae bacterium]MCY4309590.1 hypothetical protein [Paracoccaceae bacterium]